jgi:D-xylose 1-dehydrogenase (NADP+, D-xylono-1,5-lactone-forming)
MTRKLRWGILSTARINQALIAPLRVSPSSELVAVASRDLARAQEYAHQNRIPRAIGSYEDLLKDPEVDIIYNPLPNHLHAEWTIRACEAGKHVLCEKPIALTVKDVDRIKDAAQKAGVVVAEAFMYRHHPQTLAALEIVQSGELGEIRVLQGQFSFVLQPGSDIRWVPEFGGGSIWDVGCYPLNFSRAIAGVAPDEVFAWQRLSTSGIDEIFTAQMRYPNGIISQIVSDFALADNFFFKICGTKATLQLPAPFKPGLDAYGTIIKDWKETKITFPKKEVYLGEVEDMENAVFNGKPPRVSLDESRQNIATIVAALESARTSRPVKPVLD